MSKFLATVPLDEYIASCILDWSGWRTGSLSYLFLSYNAASKAAELSLLVFGEALVGLLSLRLTSARSTGKGRHWNRMSSFLESSKQNEATVALLSMIAFMFCQASRCLRRNDGQC
jgi:hypothetical protein